MSRIWLHLLLSGALLFVSGCAGKNYYKPTQTTQVLTYRFDIKSPIASVVRDGLTYADGRVVTLKRGMLNKPIPAGYHFVYDAGNAILIANEAGDVKILQEGKTRFEEHLDMALSSGAFKGSLGAFVLANNRVLLYDLKRKKVLYEEALEPSFALDSRIANPVFIKNMVIFPTLDGRLIIVDQQTHSLIKTVVLSDKPLFNNIIYLTAKSGNVIAATRYKVIAVTPSMMNEKAYDIKDAIYDGQYIYLFGNDGTIAKCDIHLKTVKQTQFDFAVFTAASATRESLYAIEKGGYALKLDKRFQTVSYFRLPEAIEKPVFLLGNKLFVGRHYLMIP